MTELTFRLLSPQGLVLCAAFFFAGIIDAVCGGGGLLTLPMFSFIGFPAHLVTGTNQCSILPGAGTSFARFAKSGSIHWKTALPAALLAVPGAFLGARLNIVLPEKWLEIIMLLLVPVVAIVLLLKRSFGSENRADTLSRPRLILSALFTGLVLGVYQGFYGAGSGTFFLLAFALLMRLDLTTASGNAKLVGFCSVIASAATYAFSGMVVWPAALAAMVFNVAGSFIGAGLALKKGARFIRPMFLFVLALLFLRLVIQWLT